MVTFKQVIFKNIESAFFKGGYRSEPIQVGNISFYYRINKRSKDADFMCMYSLNSIKSIDKIDLRQVEGVPELLCKIQLHFNKFAGQFIEAYKGYCEVLR